jgi:small GTP-binding protein
MYIHLICNNNVFCNPIRPLSYSNVDVFLLCFSLVNPTSLNNVTEKWCPELKKYARKVPIILVGLKKDLRDGKKGAETVKVSPL